jgi:hypothetical protein
MNRCKTRPYCMWYDHLNPQVTKVPHVVCCGHSNGLYTHVEAQNYSPTHYLHIILWFMVRFMLWPLYPIKYLCTSWIGVLQPASNLQNLICLLVCYAKVNLSFPSQDMYSSATKFIIATVQHFWEQSLIHSAKCCSHRNSNNGVLIEEFSCCVPSWNITT